MPTDSHVHALQYGLQKQLPLEGAVSVSGEYGLRGLYATLHQYTLIRVMQTPSPKSGHSLNLTLRFSQTRVCSSKVGDGIRLNGLWSDGPQRYFTPCSVRQDRVQFSFHRRNWRRIRSPLDVRSPFAVRTRTVTGCHRRSSMPWNRFRIR